MAEESYPFVDQPVTDVQWADLAREYHATGVIQRTTDGSDLKVTADSSGLKVKLAAGRADVRGHRYRNTTTKELGIDGGSGQPRIDSIVLRREYAGVNNIRVFVKKGTPAPTSPKPPELEVSETGVFEYALADVAVSANAVTITPANISDRRRLYASLAGEGQFGDAPFMVLRRAAIQRNSDNGYVSARGEGFGIFGAPQSSSPMSLTGNVWSNELYSWDRSTGELRVKVAGYYDLSAHIVYGVNSQGGIVLMLTKNATAPNVYTGAPGIIGREDRPSSGYSSPTLRVATNAVLLLPADTVRLVSWTGLQGGSLGMGLHDGPGEAEFSIRLNRVQ